MRDWLATKLGLRLRRGDGTRVISYLTAVLGIFSGYALFLLVWEEQDQGEPLWKFLAALGAAAAMSFAFEFLRGTVEGNTHQWSFSRVLATIVMLAAFELYIIAVHGAAALDLNTFVGVSGFIFGEQFADKITPGWNLAALGLLWVVVALTIATKLRQFIEGWPYKNSSERPGQTVETYLKDMGPDLARGAWAGIVAGAVWGAVSALAYVFLFRAFFLAQWIHANPEDWDRTMANGGPFHLNGLAEVIVDLPMLVAGWSAEWLGAAGLFLGVGVSILLVHSYIKEKGARNLAMLWPPAAILFVLGSPILSNPTTRGDLLELAGLSAVIWGIPGLLLGLLAPMLRGAAHHPPVWGVVATGAAAVLLVVTAARFESPDAARVEKVVLVAATLLAAFWALQLFQGRWAEEFWLFVALCVGLLVFGTTRAAQRVDLFAMQQKSHDLIGVALGVPHVPTLQEQIDIAKLLNFGLYQQGQSQFYVGYGTMEAKPRDVDSLQFLGHPCETVRAFTPEDRMLFSTGLDTSAAQDANATKADLTEINGTTQLFQKFQSDWANAVSNAGNAPSKGTPEMQISEVRQRLANLDGLVEVRQKLAEWAAVSTKPRPLLQIHFAVSVCQSDFDKKLVDVYHADEDRLAAEDNLAALRQRIAGELPPENELTGPRKKAEQVRDGLQTQQAQRLELAMTSSLGFWLTIGLLAMWRLTRPEPE